MNLKSKISITIFAISSIFLINNVAIAKRLMPTKNKCFSATINNVHIEINLKYYNNNVYGDVSTSTNSNEEPNLMGVSGTDSNNNLLLAFNNIAPILNDNLLWTKAKWKIKVGKKGAETLYIPISTKNNKTKKWRIVIYKFESCKE